MISHTALPVVRFQKATLPNGLDVIVGRRGELPLVAVNLWYHVGSKNEDRHQRGFAHLFEHLMFEGSLHYPGDFFKPLQRLGAGINGSTSSDRTNYYIDIPTAHVELALAMESDRMGFLLPALTEEKLRIQKDVVKNEYRQNYANRPYGQASKLLAEALYPSDHPYHAITIGDMEDVGSATLGDVESFFRRFYVPANASLCLLGDIDVERGFELADRYFGMFPGGIAALRPRTPDASLSSQVSLTFFDRVELERIYDAWHTVPSFHPDDAPLALLADILAKGQSSRLYRKLVVDSQLAQGVSVQQQGRELGGAFHVAITIRPGKSADQARGIMLDELETIAEEAVTEEEMLRAANGRVAGFIYALDHIGGFGGIADRLNAYNIYLKDPGKFSTDLERYTNVGAEDLRRVAAMYLVGHPRVALRIRPTGVTSSSPALDRRTAPPPSRTREFKAPLPLVRSLAGGSALWVLPRRDLPIVAITLVLRAGSRSHAPDHGGLADLTAAMLDEGTMRHSAFEIATRIESLGSHLSIHCGFDGCYINLQCLSGHLDESLDVVTEILRDASFPATEWDRLQGQALTSLRAQRDHAEARAHRAFLAAVFPPGHPFRLPVEGSPDSVERLRRDDLERFHSARYRPRGSAWIVSGDVDPDRLAARLDAALAGWEGEPTEPAPLPEVSMPAQPRILLLHRPGAPQAVVRVGRLGIPRSHPDFIDLSVFNQVLGGQFSSRLNESLRETKGYTYGIRSHLDCRRDAGLFVIGASLETGRLGEAIADLRAEVEKLLGDQPPTERETADACRALIEGQARHFETPSALASRFGGLFLHDLPPDEHRRLPELLASVTARSVYEASRRLIDLESLVYVVVADAEHVEGELDRLGWADVESIEDS